MINIYNKKNKNIKSNFSKNRKYIFGFSIIEVIIYLAIFTTVSVLVINSFIVILSAFNVTNMNRRLLESGSVAMERITREIRQSESISAESNLSTLILNSFDSSGDSMVVKFKYENGNISLYKNNNTEKEGSLIGGNVSVTNLTFKNITTAQSHAVRIEMTLLYSDNKNTKSENFYDTIGLRGGY
jgi:type II secretory pathway component PulJ